MSLFNHIKYSSASKNVRKIALTKTQAVELHATELKNQPKGASDWTPRKQLRSKADVARNSNRPPLVERNNEPCEVRSKRHQDDTRQYSLYANIDRYKTIPSEADIEVSHRQDVVFPITERGSSMDRANSKERRHGKRSVIVDCNLHPSIPEYMYKSGMSQPTLLSECDSPTERDTARPNNKQNIERQPKTERAYQSCKQGRQQNIPPDVVSKQKSNRKVRGLFISNIDLAKATSPKLSCTIEGFSNTREVQTPTSKPTPLQSTQQPNNQNPNQKREEMRKSRDTHRHSVRQSYVFSTREYDDYLGSKENIVMPQQYDAEQKALASSRIVKYERILGEKQKECNKLLIDNQNLMSELRSCQTRIGCLQQNYGRMEAVASTAHRTICDLRQQSKHLRDEVNTSRFMSQKEMQNKEKEFRSQLERVLTEKNDNLGRLQHELREKQSQLEHTQRRSNENSQSKLTEVQKLVQYYRKENKLLGLELFNNKKEMELLASAHETLKAELKLNSDQIELLNGSLKLKQQQLAERENMLNEKMRQGQHEKNLLYESMSKTIKSKEEEIYALRRQLFVLSSQAESGFLLKSQSATNLCISQRSVILEERKGIEDLTSQLEQCKAEINRLAALLKKETGDREKVQNEKKILLTALIEKQKKEQEQKRTDSQSKNQELDRLNEELKSKCHELDHLSHMLRSIEGKYGKTESLLAQTNEQLLRLRLQQLEYKYRGC